MANVVIGTGEVRDHHIADGADINRNKMAQRVLAKHGVPLTDLRVWDALHTNLPGTPANDDLGLVTGTWGDPTLPPYVGTGDLKAAGATTRRAAFSRPVPPDFEAAATLLISVYAGMNTTVADVSATIDVEVWKIDKDGTLGAADLCSTAATTINSLIVSEKQFTIDASGLTAGDMLLVRVSIAVNDAATATVVIGGCWAIDLRADLR